MAPRAASAWWRPDGIATIANRIPDDDGHDARPDEDRLPGRAAFDEPADDQRRGQGPEAEAQVEQVQRPAALGLEEVEEQPVPAAVEDADAETGGQGREQEDGPDGAMPRAIARRHGARPRVTAPCAGRRRSVSSPPPSDPAAYTTAYRK